MNLRHFETAPGGPASFCIGVPINTGQFSRLISANLPVL